MHTLLRAIVPLLLAACAATAGSNDGDPELVTSFNDALLGTADAEDGFLTLKGVRAAAMMHLAMYDAIRQAPPGSSDAERAAAAAAAGQHVAAAEYPDAAARFRRLAARYGAVDPAPALAAHVERGRRAATRWLRRRRDDGYANEPEYHWHPMGPGVYAEFAEHSGTPEGFIFGAGWGTARPFMLPGADHFRSPPPPDIASDAYARAFDEVKTLGKDDSTVRTADQTHLALWWKDFVERSHNRLARELSVAENLAPEAAARLFALLNASVFDAYVSVFENKFHYNHWRPYTAVRWAANDGNPATLADPGWNNTHGHTYAFPSYPSAHGTACAAAMTVLEETFGADYAFVMTTPEVDSAGPFSEKLSMTPPTRTFPSFDSAAMECALSRVYLGIHFRYDSVEGYRLGRRVGRLAISAQPGSASD